MAAIDYLSLFTRLGFQGSISYDVSGVQSGLPARLIDLWDQYEETPDLDLIGGFTQNAIGITSSASGPGNGISGLGSSTVQRMVGTSVPSLEGADSVSTLTELIRQMRADSKTVAACVVSASSAALSTSIGNGVVALTTKRGDGLVQENMVAEILRLICSSDSYTGGASAGLESFQVNGEPNTAGTWDYNWPNGSGQTTGFRAISADSSASANGTLITNGSFESWTTGTPPALNDWTLQTGTWGTDIQRSTDKYQGTYAVEFIAGTAVNTALYQEFGVDTTITPSPLNSYIVNVFLKKPSGTITAGVLTIELVDGSSVVVNDQQGVANSTTINLTTLTTSYVAHNIAFRIPEVPPTSGMRLRFRLSTALTGANFVVDSACFGKVTAAYPGGFGLCVFSGSTPFVKNDGWNITTTNNRAGASYGATFQTLFDRIFGMRTLNMLLPTSATPSYPNSLITFPGLVGYYRFENNLLDSDGGNHDLSVISGSAAYSAGKVGQCLGDATGAALTVGRINDLLSGSIKSTTYSMGGWFKVDVSPRASTLEFRTSGGGFLIRMGVGNNGGGNAAYFDVVGVAGTPFEQTTTTGVWHLVILVVSGDVGNLYLDSALVKVNIDLTGAGNFDPTGNFACVLAAGGLQPTFMDEVFVVNRALSVDNINFIYNGGTGRNLVG